MAVRDTLLKIMNEPRSHACWLNSLSYLEYRGFRKIARALSTEDVDSDILLHAMEEVRHALLFKRLAMKVGGLQFRDYQESRLLAPKAVKAYFFDLDAGVAKQLHGLSSASARMGAYCFITWLIEERAMKVYVDYNALLKQGGFDFSLDSVLREEDRHLAEMAEQGREILARHGLDHGRLTALEETVFARMWEGIAAQVNVPVELQA